MQQIIVILIISVTVFAAFRHYYKQLTSKRNGCDSCPHRGGKNCHCHENP